MSGSLHAHALEVRAGARCLVRAVSLGLDAGRVTAILGPNGAGKSTLLAVLAGAQKPALGEVHLDGQPLGAYSPAALALRRAMMPQESAVAFDFTAHEVVALGRFPHRQAPQRDDGPDGGEDGIVAAAMAQTDVQGMAGRVLNTLSGGEKARVHLARVLAQLWHPRPDGASCWLLLDEPTAALDLAHQHATMRLLRRWAGEGVGVVVVVHDLNLARRYADDVIVLDGAGSAICGAAAQVLTRERIEAVWGTPCQEVMGRHGTPQYLFG
ncbi:MAG: heme ABC transporter ATP-binding protein [Pseudomonadota bacterium]|nr:heme ABC transporter ATP-binding protein [Pseudomonadota bacterium]